MTQSFFIASEIYRRSHFGVKHPLGIARVSTVLDMTRRLGLCTALNYKTSPRANLSLLNGFHDWEYLKALEDVEKSQVATQEIQTKFQIGTLSNPVFPDMLRRPATSVGGSLLAAELIAQGGRAYALGGGLHHGMADRANGFCFLNDLVFAIRRLRALGIERIAYVDIDAHHCDGVEAVFKGDRDILMVSTHEAKRWPFTGQIEANARDHLLNIPLPRNTHDAEFIHVFERLIQPMLDRFQPQAIVIQGGADALRGDPLSRLNLTNNALWSVLHRLLDCADRILLTGGGGYNPWTVARLWTGFWAILSGQRIPQVLGEEVQSILNGLTWHRREEAQRKCVYSLFDAKQSLHLRSEIKTLVEHLRDVHGLK